MTDRQARAIELPAMGVNAVSYNYYATALPFVDVAHMGGRWMTRQPIQLTADGYPASLPAGEVAKSLIFTHNGGIYPTGLYTLRWEGKGAIQLNGANLTVVGNKPQEIQYRVAAVDPRGLSIDITATDPANPIKNVSLRAPFAELVTGRETFNPLYKKDLANYGVIRFMGWNETNNNPISKWSDRTTPTDMHWGSAAGVPYEYQIQLSNELNQDMWINVPHLADDDYVRNLAALVKQKLSPDLRVWVEYSNEVWNPGFQQFRYAADVLMPKYGVGNPAQAYGHRAAEVFDIFSSQMATTPNRLVRVLGGQAVNSWVLQQAIKGATVDGKVKADVATVAGYFSLDSDKLYQAHLQGTVNLDSVFGEMRASIDFGTQKFAENQKLAAAHGLPLVAYEGGQHVLARPGAQHNDQAFVDLLTQINRDERMGPLYTYMLDQWYQAGGKTFVFAGDIYKPNKWGAWGLQESYLDTNAVKYRAVQQYIQRLRAPNPADFNKDGAFNYRDYLIWAHTFGSTQNLTADADGDKTINGADYVMWRKAAAAKSASSALGLGAAMIPEPSTLMLAVGAISISLMDYRRHLTRS